MKKQIRTMAYGLSAAMLLGLTAPAVQPVYAGTEVYEVTLGTPEMRAMKEATLEVGETLDLNFYGVKDWNKNQANYQCKWSVEGDAATVNNWGVVTAVKGGSATVKLTVTDKLTGVSHMITPVVVTIPEEVPVVEVPETATIDDVVYKLKEDGKSYYVAGYDGYDDSVTVLAECNGLLVTEIVELNGWNIENVVLPNTITAIEEYAFGSPMYATITFQGTKAEWRTINKGNDMAYFYEHGQVVCTDGALTTEQDGVVYALSEDETSYSVVACNSEEETVTVLAECNGLPVTEIIKMDDWRVDEIVLPASITVIGEKAFGSSVDKMITFQGTKAEWQAITDANNWDYYCERGTIVCTDATIPEKVVIDNIVYMQLEDGESYKVKEVEKNGIKEKIEVLAECNGFPVVELGESVFSSWKITEIVLPNTITTIGAKALGHYDSKTIQYNGTKAEWQAITKEDDWDRLYYNLVVCTDGTLPEKNEVDGIVYVLREDGVSYLVEGKADGETTTEKLILLSEYNGLPVVEIRKDAFDFCETIAEITLPEGLTTIGESAFRYCGPFTEITLPDSVTVIGEGAFEGCNNLKKINIPEGVTVLPNNVLAGTALTEVEIPKSVTEIASEAFYSPGNGTSLLEKIYYAGTVEEWKALSENMRTAIEYEAVCSDGSYKEEKLVFALNEDGASYSVTGPKTYDYEIKNVSIPSEYNGLPVTKVADRAFGVYSYLEVVLPNTITYIGEFALGWEPQQIQFNGTKAEWRAITKVDNWEIINTEIVCTDGILPEELVIDDVVYRMRDNGESYFVFSYNNSTAVTILAECNGLPVEVVETDSWTSPKEVVITEGIITIGAGAFSNLENITLPKSITTIEADAFGWSFEGTIQYNGTKAEWNAISKGNDDNYFYAAGQVVCTDGTLPERTMVDGIVYQLKEDGIGYFVERVEGTTELEKVVIPAECNGLPVVEIGNYAFEDCDNLTEVVLPNGLTTIGEYAFSGCSNLKKINIPEGVTELPHGFLYRTAITELEIPKSVTKISEYAFQDVWWSDEADDTIIEKITYSGTMEEWKALSADIQKYNRYEAVCSDGTYISDLEMHFSLNEDGESYSFTGASEVLGGVVIVPAEYEGLPVTAVSGEWIFGINETRCIREIQLPATITSIDKYALQTPSIGSICYGGTMEEWKALGEISLSNYYGGGITKVICSDGTLEYGEEYEDWDW